MDKASVVLYTKQEKFRRRYLDLWYGPSRILSKCGWMPRSACTSSCQNNLSNRIAADGLPGIVTEKPVFVSRPCCFVAPSKKDTPVRVHVLGSGAGGGFPQWNCNCANCRGLRSGSLQAQPRTQAAIVVSADEERWYLINAGPDIRQQIGAFDGLSP